MQDCKINRILLLFHLFYYCEEVQVQELREYLLFKKISASQRTVSRDIQFLKQAGLIKARYSKKDAAYIPQGTDGHFVPENGKYIPLKSPENRTKALYMKKVIRLCTLITEMIMKKVKNPVKWYHDKYSNLSDRTRQRDFMQLKEIGYEVIYEAKDELESGRYYYRYPHGVYDELEFYRPGVELLRFLNSVDNAHMPEPAKLIRHSLADGTYRRHGNFTRREVSEILAIRIVEEQNGTGVSFICNNDMEYRFAANDKNHSDYDTPQNLLQAAIEYLQDHDAKTTLNFISSHSVQYYESPVSEGL